MSSDNKRSFGSIILLILLFALIAGVSWFFFNKDKGGLTDMKQDLAGQVSSALGYGDETSNDTHDADADTGAHAGHNHGATTTNSSNEIGTKGKIHTLTQHPLYGTRGVGNPDAPVKIQEFFSLTCNHCAEFHKGEYQEIKKNLIDTGKVYFVYEEFPLNGPALYGSMIARCLPEERYSGFIDILLRSQDKWAFGGDFKASLMQNAKLAGMSEEEFETCFNNKDLQKAVASNIKDASEVWKVNSTPSFVFNNGERILYGAKSYETFNKVVDQLINGETTSVEETTPAVQAPATTVVVPATTEAITESITGTVTDTATKAMDAVGTATDALNVPDVSDIKAPVADAVDGAGDNLQNAIEKSIDVIEDNFE